MVWEPSGLRGCDVPSSPYLQETSTKSITIHISLEVRFHVDA